MRCARVILVIFTHLAANGTWHSYHKNCSYLCYCCCQDMSKLSSKTFQQIRTSRNKPVCKTHEGSECGISFQAMMLSYQHNPEPKPSPLVWSRPIWNGITINQSIIKFLDCKLFDHTHTLCKVVFPKYAPQLLPIVWREIPNCLESPLLPIWPEVVRRQFLWTWTLTMNLIQF